MNPMQMKDPAAGVPPQLLPHLHLVSKHRYPIVSNLSLETIVNYLMEAPKIIRDLQPVQWQLLEPPTDGRLMLVWQPLEYLGTSFASDGYVWIDAEHSFQSEHRGYKLEMFAHRSGYHAPEPMATHSRRRYRLLPGNPAFPPPDPSLFIVHYTKASPRDTVPAASIPVMPHIHGMMQQRAMIQRQGQIMRKEFMLHDRASWPTINLPHGRAPSMSVAPAHRRVPSMSAIPGEASLEEEDDVARGDMLDLMTPRDISKTRYEQHHEWMEEILESQYPIGRIIPSDLGLGRKGELEALTSGFFESPTIPFPEVKPEEKAIIGKMAPGQAEAFRSKATKKIADMREELEKMRQRHAKTMERLHQASTLGAAEKKLRTASAEDPPSQTPTEDEIVQEVEQALGKTVEHVTAIQVVERGGLDPRAVVGGSLSGSVRSVTSPTKSMFSPILAQPPLPHQNGIAISTSASQQQDQHRQAQTTSPTVSTNQPTAPATESEDIERSTMVEGEGDEDVKPVETAEDEPGDIDTTTSTQDHMDLDMDVDDPQDQGTNEEEDQGVDLDDNAWVMVDENGANNDEDDNTQLSIGDEDAPSNDLVPLETSTVETSAQAPERPEAVSGPTQDAVLKTDESTTPEPIDDVNEGDFDIGGDFNDVDVDTAGDALADYGSGQEDLNLDTMEDSAFGDAFHPPDENNTPMEDQDIS